MDKESKLSDVSIILINYNTRDLTKKCLESIYEKTSGVNFEVVVVDNNSNDGSCEMIQECFPEIKLIKSESNLGFASAANIAIENSDCKYIFLLNTDTVLINNAIKVMVDFMNDNTQAAACGGALYNQNGDFVYSFGNLPRLRTYILNRLGLRFLNKPDKKNRKKRQEVEHIIGADLMLRRQALEDVGKFNTEFFLYNEELEFQYRLKNNNYKIYYLPEAEIIHLEGKSCQDSKLKIKYMRNGEYLYFKHTKKYLPKMVLKGIFTVLNMLD